MKALIQLVMAAGLTLLMAGCKSSNYEQGAAAGAGLQESADKMGQGNAKIDAALAALNDLVNKPGDLPTQFKTYSAAVSDLESTAKDVQSKVASMRGKGDAYFKAWDEQTAKIQNEDIKNRSASRKEEMMKRFTDIKTSYAQASEAFKPFLQDLKDIQTALATDLTPGGISSIKGVADKANKESVPVKDSINKLVGQFKDLGVAMGAAKPQPPPAPAK